MATALQPTNSAALLAGLLFRNAKPGLANRSLDRAEILSANPRRAAVLGTLAVVPPQIVRRTQALAERTASAAGIYREVV
jgi:hypothetical protein